MSWDWLKKVRYILLCHHFSLYIKMSIWNRGIEIAAICNTLCLSQMAHKSSWLHTSFWQLFFLSPKTEGRKVEFCLSNQGSRAWAKDMNSVLLLINIWKYRLCFSVSGGLWDWHVSWWGSFREPLKIHLLRTWLSFFDDMSLSFTRFFFLFFYYTTHELPRLTSAFEDTPIFMLFRGASMYPLNQGLYRLKDAHLQKILRNQWLLQHWECYFGLTKGCTFRGCTAKNPIIILVA